MKFFRKLKEKLFSTSSKLNNGLEEIVDKQKDEIFNQHNNETEDSNNHISLNIKEDLRKQKKEIKSHKNSRLFLKKIRRPILNLMKNK